MSCLIPNFVNMHGTLSKSFRILSSWRKLWTTGNFSYWMQRTHIKNREKEQAFGTHWQPDLDRTVYTIHHTMHFIQTRFSISFQGTIHEKNQMIPSECEPVRRTHKICMSIKSDYFARSCERKYIHAADTQKRHDERNAHIGHEWEAIIFWVILLLAGPYIMSASRVSRTKHSRSHTQNAFVSNRIDVINKHVFIKLHLRHS